MSKFVCLECGHTFDEDDIATWQESRGEYWGQPCYEDVSGCPCCNGDYVETHRCDCCDEWIEGTYVKLQNGERICKDCYILYEIGEEE